MAQLLHRIVVVLGLCAWAPLASAQTFSAGGGLFVGIQFEKGGPSFTWGGELFTTHYVQGSERCNAGPRLGLGPIAQFALRGVSDPRLTLAAHGGGELIRTLPSPRLEGELGGSFFFSDSRFALHTGVLFEAAPFFNLAVRHQVFQNQTTLTGGFRYLPTYGEATLCID